ncbi:MAG: alpha/beta hydrolase [Bacteroidales bacterium]|nr:alpha/beta hydrolase [Bacteroidales bacterium]
MNYRDTVKILAKKVTEMILIITIALLVCILVIAGVLQVLSPGKPKPYVDKRGNLLAGSLSEKVFINIGGVKQGMFIKSKDSTHPVLLYLHGGMPDYFLAQKYTTGLEDYFTVVWWEQRGSGISYSRDVVKETITLEQLINDVAEVTDYLRNRFGQEKIYLMGHSGGTFIGIQAAAKFPELYHAYIGVAQMSDQLKSERIAYNYMLKRYEKNGNKKMVRKLLAAPVVNATPDAYLKLRDRAMHSLGIGTMHDMKSVISGILLPSLTCRDYTLMEKINMWRGKSHSGVSSLWNEMLGTSLIHKVPELDIPTYIFGGVYDYTVSFTLAKEYFEKLKAPVKGFYTFERSAHSPIFEEPERVQSIMGEDVLRGVNNLADIK